jgi:hypothetical protein
MNEYFSKKSKLNIALFFLLVFIISYMIKLGYITVLYNIPMDSYTGIASDTKARYFPASDAILNGNIFKKDYLSPKATLESRPGYPIFLFFIRLISDDSIFLFNIVHLSVYPLISALTWYLSYIVLGFKISLFTACFASFSPLMTFWSRYYYSDGFFTLLVIISFICIIKLVYSDKRQVFFPVVGGVMFGCASLTRAMLFPFILFIVIWLLILKYKNKAIRFKRVIIFTLATIFVLGLWTVRNIYITGNTHIEALKTIEFINVRLERVAKLSDIEKKQMKDIKEESIVKKIPVYIKGMVMSFKIYWGISMRGSQQNFSNSNFVRLWVLYYCFTFALLILSLKFLKDKFEAFTLFWFFIIYFTLVYTFLIVVFGNVSRHRIPLEPYISILASYSLWRIFQYSKSKLWGSNHAL